MSTPEQIIDSIYEASLLPEKWADVLESVTKAAGAIGTMVISSHDGRNRAVATPSLAHVMEDFAKPEWLGKNTRGKLLLTLPQAQFHSDADHYTPEQMEQDPFYRDFIWPHGIGYAAATWIAVPNSDNLIFSVERPRKDGPFHPQTVEMLTSLRPHLARSAVLAARMGFQKVQTANKVFEVSGMASAAVRADGKVIHCNELFALRSEQVSIGAGDKLKLANEAADAVLYDCLALTAGAEPGAASRSLPLKGTETAPPAVLHLLPVRRIARDLFSHAAFFVIITSLGDVKMPPAELIRGLFDLTTAETRIARSIAGGRDVNETADDLCISRETVRFHLKQIFNKTGFSRQADLAATVARIPLIE